MVNGRFTCFWIRVAECSGVNAFAYVGGDVAGWRAFFGIYLLALEARGDVVAQLCPVFANGGIAHDFRDALFVLRACEYQHVPVGRAVVVRLHGANAVPAPLLFFDEFAGGGEEVINQIVAGVFYCCAFVFRVKGTGVGDAVKTRRGCDRDEEGHVAAFLCDKLHSLNARHHLVAAVMRVGCTGVVDIFQTDAFAVFVLHVVRFEKIAGTGLFLAEVCQCFPAHINGGLAGYKARCT